MMNQAWNSSLIRPPTNSKRQYPNTQETPYVNMIIFQQFPADFYIS